MRRRRKSRAYARKKGWTMGIILQSVSQAPRQGSCCGPQRVQAQHQPRDEIRCLEKASILIHGLHQAASSGWGRQLTLYASFISSHLQHLDPFSCSSASALPQVSLNISQSPATSFGLNSKERFSLPSSLAKPPLGATSQLGISTHPGMLRAAPANCGTNQQSTAPAQGEAGSASPPSNARLRHAQQFSILSAIFCSTELVVCIELVFIFPNMIYKHNHVSDFDIALGSTAGMHPSPSSAGWGAPRPRRSLQWEYSKCGWILLSPSSSRAPPAPRC